jgi:ABC-type branched-subunit amino acid transport system ATPase component
MDSVPAGPPLIRVDKLTKRYGRLVALSEVSFEVRSVKSLA